MGHYIVTGSAGMIGSSVSRILLDDGHSVMGIDNLNDSYDVRMKEWRINQLKIYPEFDFHTVDICDFSIIRSLFREDIDAVINLAAKAGVRESLANPWSYYETNVTGTMNLLELCKEFRIRKFVLASTSSLYGESQSQPFSESQITDYPLSPYAASKKAAESLCYTYHHLYGIDISIPRYFTVYGPAGRPDMAIFRFIQWISEGLPLTIFGDGNQTRDFTYVDDIARGTVLSIKNLGYEIINLGSDKPVSINHCITLIEDALDQTATRHYLAGHPADVHDTWANINKARTLIDWEPQNSLQNGIKSTVTWYLNNRSLARTIKTG